MSHFVSQSASQLVSPCLSIFLIARAIDHLVYSLGELWLSWCFENMKMIHSESENIQGHIYSFLKQEFIIFLKGFFIDDFEKIHNKLGLSCAKLRPAQASTPTNFRPA